LKKPTTAQIFLLLAALLAPIIGGQLNTEATYLPADPILLVRSIFSGIDQVISYFIRSYQPTPAIETPTLSHALVGLLLAGAALLVLLKRRVFQVPPMRISIPLMLFFAWMLCTLAFSQYTTYSLTAVAEWATYGIAFYIAVAAAGRRRGSFYLIAAIVAGCALVAFKGLFEYGAIRQFNPTWRVFSTWANPTSLAGMMTIGMMLGLGLSLYVEDLLAVIPWTAGLAMGCCIMVTDSRGGVFSMLVGMICLGGLSTFWSSTKEQMRANLLKLGAVFVLVVLFGRWVHPVAGTSHSNATTSIHQSGYMLAGQSTSTPAAAAPTDAATAQGEQSSGFRILLWKGAAKLMTSNPLGSGMGTYRFLSAKPGLTTETQLTHNSYLQVGVEAGLLGLVFLLAFFGLWLFEVVKGCYAPLRPISFLRIGGVIVGAFLALEILSIFAHVEVFPTKTLMIGALFGVALVWLYVELFRKPANLAMPQNMLRAAIIAAVVGMLFDNMLESGLYSYGVGVCAFLIMGVGLVQAADGVAPEFIPKVPRILAGVAAALAAFFVLHAGVVEMYRSRVRDERQTANSLGIQSTEGTQALELANSNADAALNVIPFIDQADGETWRLKASLEPSYIQRLEDLKKAADLHPNSRNLRAVGDAEVTSGSLDEAIPYYTRALTYDPNNLLTLSRLLATYDQSGQPERAMEIARQTVAVESTPYFEVRSLPEIIPTESYDAHFYIGARTADLNVRAQEMEKAIAGYKQYLVSTYPMLLEMARSDPTNPDASYGGESLPLARSKMRVAASYAEKLGELYRQQHKFADASRTMQLQQQFAAAAGPEPS